MILIYSLFQSRHSLATPGLPWGGEVTVKMTKLKFHKFPNLEANLSQVSNSVFMHISVYLCLFVFSVCDQSRQTLTRHSLNIYRKSLIKLI